MGRILYHGAGIKSAPLLGAFMGIEAVRVLNHPVDFLIRWGMATKAEIEGVEVNKRKSLIRYFSRFKQLQLLKAADVSVPPFSTAPDVGYPMLGRNEGKPNRQPTKGRGITYYPESANHPHHSFFMRFFPKQRQFRVHIIGKQTRTRELIPNGEANLLQPIWNFECGFTYRNLKTSRPEGVIPQARKAISALALDFGAVDIIVHDGQPYVLEVNTAPGLGDLTLSWYARHLAPLVGLNPKTLPGLEK